MGPAATAAAAAAGAEAAAEEDAAAATAADADADAWAASVALACAGAAAGAARLALVATHRTAVAGRTTAAGCLRSRSMAGRKGEGADLSGNDRNRADEPQLSERALLCSLRRSGHRSNERDRQEGCSSERDSGRQRTRQRDTPVAPPTCCPLSAGAAFAFALLSSARTEHDIELRFTEGTDVNYLLRTPTLVCLYTRWLSSFALTDTMFRSPTLAVRRFGFARKLPRRAAPLAPPVVLRWCVLIHSNGQQLQLRSGRRWQRPSQQRRRVLPHLESPSTAASTRRTSQ